MPSISDARILFIATDGFEDSELLQPFNTLEGARGFRHARFPRHRRDQGR